MFQACHRPKSSHPLAALVPLVIDSAFLTPRLKGVNEFIIAGVHHMVTEPTNDIPPGMHVELLTSQLEHVSFPHSLACSRSLTRICPSVVCNSGSEELVGQPTNSSGFHGPPTQDMHDEMGWNIFKKC